MRLPSFSLAGQVAVVTGASRGIGQAIAIGLAEAGARVIAAGRDQAALAETVAGIQAAGGAGEGKPLDVTDIAAVDRFFGGLARLMAGSISWSTMPASRMCVRLSRWTRLCGTASSIPI